MTRNFYIGESLITREDVAPCFKKAWKENPFAFVETLRQLEIFSSSEDKAKLNQICIVHHDGINLLPPNYGGDKWEYNWARLVAKHIYDRLLDDYEIVYIAGRRSQEAFGLRNAAFCTPCKPTAFREYSFNDTSGMTTFVPIPAPSSNSQWWANESEVTIARNAIQQLTKRIALGV